MKRIILFLLLNVLLQGLMQAQNSVSIGTDGINEDAVLQLISPGDNQGFLVPKLTTVQRQAMNLQNDDDAMLVFDSDIGLFFFWYENNWIQLSTGSDNDSDPANEIQDLYLEGTNLSITRNPSATVIDLSSYLNTDDQLLEFNNTTSQLSIEDGNSVDLSPLINDADADPTNELNTGIAFDGINLTITDAGGNQTIDISSLEDDADADSTNEIISYGGIINDELIIAEGEDTIRIDVGDLQDTFSGWELNGNAGTDPSINYLGTSDNADLSVRTGGTERMRFNAVTGNVGIGVGAAQERLHVDGNIRANGNLQLASGGIIDDDATYGENSDDWIRLNGFIEMKSNTDNYGILLRDRENNEYLGITQVDGYSYFSDNSTYGNYFLRGDGADAHIRYNLTAGRQISSGNGYDVVSGDQFVYTNTQTRYKIYPAASINTAETKSFSSDGAYAYNFNGFALIHIDLPDGALITQIQIRVRDDDGGGFLDPDNNIYANIYLTRYDNDIVYTAAGTLSTSGAPGMRTLTFNFNPGYNIVSSLYGYFIRLDFDEDSSQHRFYWARITYTVAQAD